MRSGIVLRAAMAVVVAAVVAAAALEPPEAMRSWHMGFRAAVVASEEVTLPEMAPLGPVAEAPAGADIWWSMNTRR